MPVYPLTPHNMANPDIQSSQRSGTYLLSDVKLWAFGFVAGQDGELSECLRWLTVRTPSVGQQGSIDSHQWIRPETGFMLIT